MKTLKIEDIKKLDPRWEGDFDGGYFLTVDYELSKKDLFRVGLKDNSIIVIDKKELNEICSLIDKKTIEKLVENEEPIILFEETDKYGDLIFPAIKKVINLDYDNLYVNAFDIVIDQVLKDKKYS